MRLNTHARSLFLPVLAAAALAACSDDSTAPSDKFTGTTGFTLLNASNPIDITPDGQTVVVEDLLGTLDNPIYFYNVSTGAYTHKTSPGSPFMNFATGVSGDLKVSALYNEPVVSGVWSEVTDWVSIPSMFDGGCDMNVGGAWDISHDGHTMVGFDWNGCSTQAMRYSEAGGAWTAQQLELIGAPYPDSPSPQSNRATVVSGNGLVAAGWAQTEIVDRSPAVWQADGTGSLLTSGVSSDTPGEVLGINVDGSIMVGTWGGQGFIWNAGTVNFIESLPSNDEFANTYPQAIAANGQLIFGGSGGQAFVWTAGAGTRKLQDIATAAGIEIPQGVVLNTVKAASADGTIVIGQAINAQLRAYSFVLKLPASAYGI
jgi:hypothetical protein